MAGGRIRLGAMRAAALGAGGRGVERGGCQNNGPLTTGQNWSFLKRKPFRFRGLWSSLNKWTELFHALLTWSRANTYVQDRAGQGPFLVAHDNIFFYSLCLLLIFFFYFFCRSVMRLGGGTHSRLFLRFLN